MNQSNKSLTGSLHRAVIKGCRLRSSLTNCFVFVISDVLSEVFRWMLISGYMWCIHLHYVHSDVLTFFTYCFPFNSFHSYSRHVALSQQAKHPCNRSSRLWQRCCLINISSCHRRAVIVGVIIMLSPRPQSCLSISPAHITTHLNVKTNSQWRSSLSQRKSRLWAVPVSSLC